MREFDDRRKPKRGVQIDAPRIYLIVTQAESPQHEAHDRKEYFFHLQPENSLEEVGRAL